MLIPASKGLLTHRLYFHSCRTQCVIYVFCPNILHPFNYSDVKVLSADSHDLIDNERSKLLQCLTQSYLHLYPHGDSAVLPNRQQLLHPRKSGRSSLPCPSKTHCNLYRPTSFGIFFHASIQLTEQKTSDWLWWVIFLPWC